MFSYKPLLRLLVEKDMTKTQLRVATGMSMNTLAKISKNEYNRICKEDCVWQDQRDFRKN